MVAPRKDLFAPAQEKHGATNNGYDVTKGDKDDAAPSFLCYNILKQTCLVSIWVVMGFLWVVVSPAIPDLKVQLGVNYEEIGRALAARSAGLFIGGIAGGFLHEALHKHVEVVMAVGLILGALGLALVPWCSSLAVLALLLHLTGLSVGLSNTCGNTMVMDIWGSKAAMPMHLLHFGFGLGAIITPQLVQPFLCIDEEADASFSNGNISSEAYTTSGMTFDDINLTHNLPMQQHVDLTVPFVVSAALNLAVAFAMFIFYIKGLPAGYPKRKAKTDFKSMLSPATCSGGNTAYGTIMLVFLFIYFIQTIGAENVYLSYLFSYAVDADVNFTKQQASTLLSLCWGCYVAGRFINAFIAHFIKPQYMITVDIIGLLVLSILASIFAYDSPRALWILSAVYSTFVSVMFPNGMCWANRYLTMNSMSTMVCIIGAASGAFIYYYLLGFLFEFYGVQSLMYTCVACVGCTLVIFLAMQTVAHWFKPKPSAMNATHIHELEILNH